jgi:transcriptional regulator with XRE-family HTH domain
MRCYISRVENGHTIPSLETLSRIAKALETDLSDMFRDGSIADPEEQEFYKELRTYLPSLSVKDREQVMDLVRKMVGE